MTIPLPTTAPPTKPPAAATMLRGGGGWHVPPWVAMASVLAFAWMFRYAGLFAADQMPDGGRSDGTLARIIFLGVALLAAGIAAIAGKIWTSPTGAVAMGVLGGLAATRYEDNIPEALLGLVVGLLIATSLAWKASRRAGSLAVTSGFGALAGGGVVACLRMGGMMGVTRAAGIVVAAALCVAAFQPGANQPQPTRGTRLRTRILLGGGAVAGAIWLSGPLARWAGV